MNNKHWRLLASSAVVIGGVAGAQAAGLEIKVLSSAAELVSGKEALVELTGVTDPPVVTVNGRTSGQSLGLSGVRSNFKVSPSDPSKQIGMITGMQLGPNQVTIQSGRNSGSITLIAHDVNN